MNIEDPKNKKFYVCVNGDAFEGKTDEEIELDEKFIGALENAVIDMMVPVPNKIGKLGEIVKERKIEHRFRVVRMEKGGNKKDEDKEEKEVKKRGNPNWHRKPQVEPEASEEAANE